ncbi:5'-3' exoribonuclease 1; AltName: Full=Exonuclease 2; AltName: Full=Exonuclease II; Short=Exo II; AltName: Full=p140 [Serendipita indica DSM 11827]|nr:5'-3' exoribonuclease 1; AltName: Full=Exonuclease 2; AltName: Full=Exonuclease II; Short=Exo II; AltName: Full=p140 [Serendipita indica DSM 11827]
MAIDGVAPRAKMNQQRSRRFRTAKETKDLVEKALRKGEKLPDEKAFDSNCITPGTPFMARLSLQLQYFVNKKITEDSNWRDVQVILSGHEVPGEGEHKIMEYIRLSKAQKDYNPNTRHCLYGLDADLIMLGLLSHDPHFALLREEVKFGPQAKKKSGTLETQSFFLLHLCLFREYLNLEFQPLWDPKAINIADPSASSKPILPFEYSLERIIDDFILLAVFVGNDFLPHLPDLHIHDNALEVLFEKYRETLPKAGGYLNESGVINTERLQMVLDALATFEQQAFEKEHSDMNWFKSKQRPKQLDTLVERGGTGGSTITRDQQQMFKTIEAFVLQARGKRQPQQVDQEVEGVTKLSFVNTFAARDRAFLSQVAKDLHLSLTWDEYNDEDQNLAVLRLPSAANEDEDSDEDEEGRRAVDRVLKKYARAKILEDEGTFDERYETTLKARMDNWKRQYYQEKLEIKYDDKEAMDKLVYRYIEGLQWVMHYYYSGVASWGWFYDYHYAPRISDLKGVDKMKFDFKLGIPFRPYEQLMGVLPAASQEHIPQAYRDLMYDPTSPILDFYPTDFESDLNGKKQEWEAIVKIPFINEQRLLQAMASREHRLTKEEKERNTVGTSLTFTYSPNQDIVYPSSLPGFFPDIHHCHCITKPFNLPTLDGLHLVKGLLEGVGLGVHAMAGFPSLDTLPHTAQLIHHSVNVFQADSRNQSVVLYIKNLWEGSNTLKAAEKLIGKRVFYNWPFLQEGMVVALSDSHFRYEYQRYGNGVKVAGSQHSAPGLSNWARKAEGYESRYSKRFGVITGDVDILVHVRPLKGLRSKDDGSLVKDWDDADKETDLPLQMLVQEVNFEDERFMEQAAPSLVDEFPQGSKVFFLGEHAYGVVAQVEGVEKNALTVTLAFFPKEKAENEQLTNIALSAAQPDYYTAYNVANMLRMTGLAVSKITSSLMVISSDGSKTNLGLSLKFQGKGLKVLTYTRMEGNGWEFSAKAVELLRDYKAAFPQLFSKLDNRGDAMLKASEVFIGKDPDAQVKAAKAWLAERGIKDLEPVPLSTETLEKETISQIEAAAAQIAASRTATGIKKAKVQGIPRQAVLKPIQVHSRLKDQVFKLGDRVIMVQDSGGVPLCNKGIVVGIVDKMIDVVWDNAFIGGSTLGGRCSEYRGSTCTINSCLNLTNQQFIVATTPTQQARSVPVHLENAYGIVTSSPTPTNGRGRGTPPMRIMSNHNSGRGTPTNGTPNSKPQRGTNGYSGGLAPTNHQQTSSESRVPMQDDPPAVNLFHAARGRGLRGRGPVIPRGGRGGPHQAISVLQRPLPTPPQNQAQQNQPSPAAQSAPAQVQVRLVQEDGPQRQRGRGGFNGRGEQRGRGGRGGGRGQRPQNSPTVPS